MTESVFSVMKDKGLTSLEIFNDKRAGNFLLRGAKEWQDSQRWENYMEEFTPEDILTDGYFATGTKELLEDFSKLGLVNYLESIKKLLHEGRHHGIEFYYNRRLDIRVMYCKSVNTLGMGNKRHAIRAGGIRRHEPGEAELDVLIDGLNLARAMTYKNALIDIPFGGSKILVQCDPVSLEDYDTLGFLAYIIDRSRSFTGPDMGFEPAMTDVMRQRFTNAITGGLKSPMGPTGGITAYGGYLAIKEACSFLYGNPELKGRQIAVQGLGACGYPLSRHFLKEGAVLTVTDTDYSLVEKLKEEWGPENVSYVEPGDIYTVEADIFAPCAVGGVITEDIIDKLKFKAIMGVANNLIKATSNEAEIDIAKKLQKAGILFIAEWALNSSGVLTGWAEYIYGKEASFKIIEPKIELTSRQTLGKLLKEAKNTGKTPTEMLYDKIEDAVASGGSLRQFLN